MKHIKLYEAFIGEANRNVPQIWVKYRRALERAKYLEEDQKKLAEPFFAAKNAGDEKTAQKHLKSLKKNQEKLTHIRGVIAHLETNYINNMDFHNPQAKAGKYDASDWGDSGTAFDGTEWY